MKRFKQLLLICLLVGPLSLFGQQSQKINWLSFEELEVALNERPKKVFIDFYTDWCSYCRKMDKSVFTKPAVVELLNKEYYAVRFNAESLEAINFGGHTFINDQYQQSRRPMHQIAQLLALRKNKFVAPTLVALDKDFKVTARYFEYLNSNELLEKFGNSSQP